MTNYYVTTKRHYLDKDLALSFYKEGLKDCEIAEKCEVTRGTVSSWRNRNGLPPNRRRKKEIKLTSMERLEKAANEASRLGMTYGQYSVKTMKKNGTDIHENIRLAIKANGMTQKELAKITGISPTSINWYCTGKQTPQPGNLQKLADALNVKQEFLTGKSSVGKKEEPKEAVWNIFDCDMRSGVNIFRCSHCGEFIATSDIGREHFCRGCGYKMEVEDEI